MTQENEIIETAMNSGLPSKEAAQHQMWWLEVFAKLVAAKEREACAKLCIDEVWASSVIGGPVEAFNFASRECANRIRARGKA